MPTFVHPDLSRFKCSQFMWLNNYIADMIFILLFAIDIVIIGVYVVILVGMALRKKVTIMTAVACAFLLLNSIFIAAQLLVEISFMQDFLGLKEGSASLIDFGDIGSAFYEFALLFFIIHFWISIQKEQRKVPVMIISCILLFLNGVAYMFDAVYPDFLRELGLDADQKRILFSFTFLIQAIAVLLTYFSLREITSYRQVQIWRWQRAYVHFLLIFTGIRAVVMFCIRLIETTIHYVPGQPKFEDINIFLQALSYIVFTELVLILIAVSTFTLNQDYFLRIGYQKSPGTLLDPTGSTHIQERALTPKQKKILLLTVLVCLYVIAGFWSAHETCRVVGNGTTYAHLLAKGAARILSAATIFEVVLILPQVLAVIRGAKWGIIFNVLDMIEYHVYNGIIIFICTCIHTGGHIYLFERLHVIQQCLCLGEDCILDVSCYWFPGITGIILVACVFIITLLGYFMHKRKFMKSYKAKFWHRVLGMVYTVALLLHPMASILDLPVFNTSALLFVLVIFIWDYLRSHEKSGRIVSFAILKDGGRGEVTLPFTPTNDGGNPLTSLSNAELQNDLILVIDVAGPVVGSIRGKYFDLRYAETHFHPFTIASYNKKRNRIRFFIKIDPIPERWTNVLLSILQAENDWEKILTRNDPEIPLDDYESEYVSSDTPEGPGTLGRNVPLADVGRGDNAIRKRDILVSKLTSVEYPMQLQGPFSSPIRNVLCLPERNESERLCFVLISGGSGVTVATSFLQDIFECSKYSEDSQFYVTFCFSTRNRKFLALIYEKIKNLTNKYPTCGMRIHLRVYLYHTRGEAINVSIDSSEKVIYKIKQGRMNCQNIIQKAGARFIQDATELSTVRIVVCSKALSESTRQAVDNLSLAPREGLFYDFSYEVF